ncbi:dihydroorotate oxidase [Aerococcaceae bacterium DSM 111020]|nr:dihydroorotate oxidase [Aerococcaceae bacterium DSM 111020]
MAQLNTQLAGRHYISPLMNASGIHCGLDYMLDELTHSKAATYITKSATLQKRLGNPEPRYYNYKQNSLNSMGLPNEGIDYYLKYVNQDPQTAQRILSITPLTIEDIPLLSKKIDASGYDGLIEINLSCPNILGKPQIGYDFDQMAHYMKVIDQSFYPGSYGVKLPPYFDLVHFDMVAQILNQYPLAFVNSINSVGNALMIHEQQTVIFPKNGHGGLGGATIKPIALANVHAFYQRLNKNIDIIGTGGITNGRDVFEFILCGASMVQLGTVLAQKNLDIFEQIENELHAEMDKYDYKTISEFKGKLQYIQENDAISGASH